MSSASSLLSDLWPLQHILILKIRSNLADAGLAAISALIESGALSGLLQLHLAGNRFGGSGLVKKSASLFSVLTSGTTIS